jgi:hypothetical protein
MPKEEFLSQSLKLLIKISEDMWFYQQKHLIAPALIAVGKNKIFKSKEISSMLPVLL